VPCAVLQEQNTATQPAALDRKQGMLSKQQLGQRSRSRAENCEAREIMLGWLPDWFSAELYCYRLLSRASPALRATGASEERACFVPCIHAASTNMWSS